MRYWDDMPGEELDGKLVREARREEIQVVRQMGVWEKVPRTQCLAETGKSPIGTLSVDVDKGDEQNPKLRSGIVAQELNRSSEFELFAANPPIEYIKFLLVRTASKHGGQHPSCFMVVDVKKAYFYAPSTRREYVQIPPEDQEPGDESKCALLHKSLYGTRDAALNWSIAYGKVMKKCGFKKGLSSPLYLWEC